MNVRSLLTRLQLACLRYCIQSTQLDIHITLSEMQSGPARIAIYQKHLSRLRDRAAALEQRLK